MNLNVSTVANDVINDLVNANESFSAFDVTRLVRRKVGATLNVRHSEIRDIVRDYSYPTDYLLSDVQVSSGEYTRIHHPAWVDPHNNYDENKFANPTAVISAQNNNPISFTSASGNSVITVPTSSVSNSPIPSNSIISTTGSNTPSNKIVVDKVKPDSYGRLTVRAKLLRAAGFNKGTKIHLWGSTGKTHGNKPKLVIAGPNSQTGMNDYGILTVDKSNNVRLSSHKLGLVGLSGTISSEYKQESHPHSISIEAI